MSRQVLTLPDVPVPPLLTQTQAQALFVELAGDTMTGALVIQPGALAAGAPMLSVVGASGTYRSIQGFTGGSVRWHMALGTGEAEGGSNAGSNFHLYRYDDTGTYLGNVLDINRATGNAVFGASVSAAALSAGGKPVIASPDAGNTFEWRANGFYAAAGSGGADVWVNTTGDTMTGILTLNLTVGASYPTAIVSNGSIGIGVTPSPIHPARRALFVGDATMLMSGAGYNATELRVNSYQDASNVAKPLMGGNSAGSLSLVNDGLSFANAPVAAAGVTQVFTPRFTVSNNGYTSIYGTRPGFEAREVTASAPARFGQFFGGPIAYMTANALYNGASWNLDDTTKDGCVWFVYGAPGAEGIGLDRFPAGGNPADSRRKRQFQLTAQGTLNLYPDTGYYAISTGGNIGGGTLHSTNAGNAGIRTGVGFLNYDGGGENWAGIGRDVNGYCWWRIGTSEASCGGLFIQPTVFRPWRSNFMSCGDPSFYWNAVYTYIVDGGGTYIKLRTNSSVHFDQPAGTYAHPINHNSQYLGHAGYSWYVVYTGNLQSGSGQSLNLYSQADITVNPASGVFVPQGDNAKACGWTTARWSTVHAANGSIQTSHVSQKKDFAPLDPVACVTAVLETNWLSYNYIDPNPPAPMPARDNETSEQRQERTTNDVVAMQQYYKMVKDTAFTRKQKGYVLGSDQYHTDELFGLADRRSANTQADLAVVACALQQALQRIAVLEGKAVS